eukprot:TRINITY_DN9125_c0_g1_i1.p1 TRINITY_DN9125_c0_g1~~TRINITY_DN9125_c0_g1_i1.p1  ORF type:complete len:255 (+),score=64.72 TRINITY_DN9125_c0_g1_i1:93-767(+)
MNVAPRYARLFCGVTQKRCVTSLPDAMKVFGMDQGVPFPRGRAGRDAHPALVGANKEGVAKRYKELVRVYHPDAPTGDTAEMTRVNQAYRILLDELPSRPDSNTEDVDEDEPKGRRSRAKQQKPPEKPPHMKEKEKERLRAQERQREEFAGSMRGSVHMDHAWDTEKQALHLRHLSALQQRAARDRRAPREVKETCEIREQLKRENGGQVLKQNNVKAKQGTWL